MKLILKRVLFYLLSFTWGGIMTCIGILVLLFTLPFGEFGIYHGRIYKRIGKNWGGIALGCFFFCDRYMGEHTLAHESGHGLQNCIWGPLFPIIIALPSVIRCSRYNFLCEHNREKYALLPDYDSIWFEGQATKWGLEYIKTNKI